MLNLGLKLSSWRYKQSLKRCVLLQDGKTLANAAARHRSGGHRTSPNASFVDGVATKDCVIGVVSSLSVRIFLPQHCLRAEAATGNQGFGWLPSQAHQAGNENGSSSDVVGGDKLEEFIGGYHPRQGTHSLKLPMVVQFHDGAFISGSKDSAANDVFCRRIAKSCKCVVVAVGYRLAPEHRYPAAMEDGLSTLRWLAKQANMAAFSSSTGVSHGIVDSLGHMLVDPWISAHVDFSRCALLGVGAGGTIAYQVCRSARDLKSELDPLKVMGQVLLYPLFRGPTSLPSEKDLANAYFMDQETLSLSWSCMLPEGENYADQPTVDPTGSSLTDMPPALVIAAEQDMLRDRAVAYVDALKEARIDATLMIYRNAFYGFATLDFFINTKLAQACVEDIAIWLDKHVRCSYWS